MDIIRELENEQLKSEVTPFNVGDNSPSHAKVVEGTEGRQQMFHNAVIKRQGGGIRETFTVDVSLPALALKEHGPYTLPESTVSRL